MSHYYPSSRGIICVNCKSNVILGDKLYKTGDRIRCSRCKTEMVIGGFDIFK